MNIVDVEHLEREEMKKNIIHQIASKELPPMPKPQKLYGIKPAKQQKQRLPKPPPQPKIKIDKDFVNSIDTIIYNVMALPMKDIEKRDILKKRLRENKFIDKYIKDKIYLNYLGYLNDDLKFGLVYGTTYYDVYKNSMMDLEEQEKKKPKPKPKLEIEIDNESIPEIEIEKTY